MACCNRRCRRITTTVRNYNQNGFIPSSAEVFNSTTQTVAPNAQVVFNQTNYNTGVSFSPRQDGLGIDIIAAGVYQITFTGSATTTQNGNISLAISQNGTVIPQSEITQYITTNGPQNVMTTIIFKVTSPNAEIEIINTGNTNFDVTNAKIDIVRNGNF